MNVVLLSVLYPGRQFLSQRLVIGMCLQVVKTDVSRPMAKCVTTRCETKTSAFCKQKLHTPGSSRPILIKYPWQESNLRQTV